MKEMKQNFLSQIILHETIASFPTNFSWIRGTPHRGEPRCDLLKSHRKQRSAGAWWLESRSGKMVEGIYERNQLERR